MKINLSIASEQRIKEVLGPKDQIIWRPDIFMPNVPDRENLLICFPYTFFLEDFDPIFNDNLKIIVDELGYPQCWDDCELPFCPWEFENWHERSGWEHVMDKRIDAHKGSARDIIYEHLGHIRFWDPNAPGEKHGHKGVWTYITHKKTGYDQCIHELFFKNLDDYLFLMFKYT